MISLWSTDTALFGTTKNVVVTIALAKYPAIKGTISFSVKIEKSCPDAILTAPLSSQVTMINDEYLTTTAAHSQSYESILTGTTNDMGANCGAFGIKWYQTTPGSLTPVLADSSVF